MTAAQLALPLHPPQPWMPCADNATVGFPLARVSDPPTSHAAAASVAEVSEAQRLLILGALDMAGPRGANASELDAALGFPAATSGRRLGELAQPKHGSPLAVKTSEKRATASGCDAYVYVAGRYALGRAA